MIEQQFSIIPANGHGMGKCAWLNIIEFKKATHGFFSVKRNLMAAFRLAPKVQRQFPGSIDAYCYNWLL